MRRIGFPWQQFRTGTFLVPFNNICTFYYIKHQLFGFRNTFSFMFFYHTTFSPFSIQTPSIHFSSAWDRNRADLWRTAGPASDTSVSVPGNQNKGPKSKRNADKCGSLDLRANPKNGCQHPTAGWPRICSRLHRSEPLAQGRCQQFIVQHPKC